MNMLRTTLVCLLAALPMSSARGADYTIKAGSTDVSVYVYLSPTVDGTGALGSARYVRPGASPVSFLSTELTAIDSAHADGKWKVVSGDIGAVYRVDLPDAAVATGARSVDLVVHEGGGYVGHVSIDLVGYDPTAANLPANVTQISGGATAADNAESYFDGTGYGERLLSSTVSSVTSQTKFALSGVSGNDGALLDSIIILRDSTYSTTRGVKFFRVTDFDAVDEEFTVEPLGGTGGFMTVSVGDFVDVYAPALSSLLAGVKTKTDFLSSATAGAAGGLFIAGSNAGTTVDFTGSLSGSVGSVTGNVGGSVASVVDKIDFSLAANQSGVTIGTVNNLAGHIPQTGDAFAIVSDGAFGNSALKTILDTKSSQTSVGAVQTDVDSLLAYFDGAPTFAQAMDAQGYTVARAEKIDRLAPTLLVSTTVDGSPANETEFVIADGPTNNDALNGALVIVTRGPQKAVGIVRDYVAASKTVTLVTDLGTFAIEDDDQVDIIAGGPVPLWIGAN